MAGSRSRLRDSTKLSELLVSRWRPADSAGFCFGGVPGLGAHTSVFFRVHSVRAMASADYKFVAPAGDGDTLVGPYITSLANDRSLNVDPGHWFHSSRALELPDGSKLPPSIRVAVYVLAGPRE